MKPHYFTFYTFFALLLLISSCTSKVDQQLIKNNGKGLFLVAGKQTTIDDWVEASVVFSNIRLKGYVVIVGIKSALKNEQAIKKTFYKNEIMAVHIFNFKKGQILKKTDILALENAEIILFPEIKKDDYKIFINNPILRKVLRNARNNGALITAKGNSISMIGRYFFKQKLLYPGMALADNLVLDNFSFFEKNKTVVQKEVSQKQVTFIGIDDQSMILFNDKKGQLINDSKTVVVYPNKKSNTIEDQEIFSVIPYE